MSKKIPTKFGLKYGTNGPPFVRILEISHWPWIMFGSMGFTVFLYSDFDAQQVAKERDLPIGRPDQPGQLFWAKLVSENGDLPDLPIKKAFLYGEDMMNMMINHQILGYQNLRQTKMSRESQPVSPTWKMWTKRNCEKCWSEILENQVVLTTWMENVRTMMHSFLAGKFLIIFPLVRRWNTGMISEVNNVI